jgi:transposase
LQIRKPKVSFNGTSVGLDVHALSVVTRAVDEATGHVERHGCARRAARSLGGSADAGSGASGLRGQAHGIWAGQGIGRCHIDCTVAPPSKLIRPPGDRVKTDARDAAHLTRLLRLGEITAVTVPEREMEAVRET